MSLGSGAGTGGHQTSALALGLLAIPLAFVNPRGGNSLNQLFALLIYLTYSNIVSVTQSMVTKETLDFWVALVLPHACVLALFYLLILKRNRPAGAPLFVWRKSARSLDLQDVVASQEIKR